MKLVRKGDWWSTFQTHWFLPHWWTNLVSSAVLSSLGMVLMISSWSNWQNSGLIIMYFDCDACQKNYSATASFIIHRRVSHPHLTFINVHCAKTTHYIDTYRLKRTGARDTIGWWPRDLFTVTWYVINFEYVVSLCHPESSTPGIQSCVN